MAEGSEQFTWKKVWPWERECSACKRTLRTQDVGEHRSVIEYVNGVGVVAERFLWCTEHRGGRA